jgi:hypothetical protein
MASTEQTGFVVLQSHKKEMVQGVTKGGLVLYRLAMLPFIDEEHVGGGGLHVWHSKVSFLNMVQLGVWFPKPMGMSYLQLAPLKSS